MTHVRSSWTNISLRPLPPGPAAALRSCRIELVTGWLGSPPGPTLMSTCVCSVCLLVWMLACPYPTEALCPKPQFMDAGTLTPGPQIAEYRFPAPGFLQGGRRWLGEAGERTCRGYTADFYFFFWLSLCLSFLVCQGKALPHEIHNARTNKHASGPWSCLNTARTCCHSPPAFGYTLLYTHTHGLPLPVHNHTHTNRRSMWTTHPGHDKVLR